MSVEMVVVTDERGVEIFFVDLRTPLGSLVDSRFFQTETAAREFLALQGE